MLSVGTSTFQSLLQSEYKIQQKGHVLLCFLGSKSSRLLRLPPVLSAGAQTVRSPLQSGYTITQKVLLASIPPPTNGPTLRVIMYALEATFCCVFWVLNPPDFYAYYTCCPWEPSKFEYIGICSHVLLNDVMYGVGWPHDQPHTRGAYCS
jgi:hypothetical protein